MTVRRALAVTPDDADLLALYAESLQQVDRTAGQRALRRAAHVRILEARERAAARKPEEAVRILRAVLKEDPQNREALEALGKIETAAPPARGPRPKAAEDPAVMTGKFSHRAGAAGSIPRPAANPSAGASRRPPTPVLIGGGAAILIAAASLAMLREAPAASVEPAPAASLAVSGPAAAERAAEDTDRAFAGQDPELRRAVEEVLTRYARALETIDGALLADTRPDMPAKVRAALMADREGATNIAADLRVLAVARRGTQATVRIRRTEVVVEGRAVDRPSVEETLRFQRDGGAWVLRPSR